MLFSPYDNLFWTMWHVQELQHASQEAAGAAVAVRQLGQELQDVSKQQQQLQAQHEICSSSHHSSDKKLREVTQQLQQLGARLANQTADLTGLAESVLGCLSAARAHAAAAVAAAAAAPQLPNSYLSNLLGPAGPAAAAAAAPAGKHLQWGAWVSARQRPEMCRPVCSWEWGIILELKLIAALYHTLGVSSCLHEHLWSVIMLSKTSMHCLQDQQTSAAPLPLTLTTLAACLPT
jgi:hypothetical protein